MIVNPAPKGVYILTEIKVVTKIKVTVKEKFGPRASNKETPKERY